ncbi:MAG: glycosyl hydrolase 115 family protein [Mediterranea sp.]|jgi:hypothetical protein|nr:glycosyl hydrolase 115 family protein [Mediterranea sp.]
MLKKIFWLLTATFVGTALPAKAKDHHGVTQARLSADHFTLIANGVPTPILIDANEDTGVKIAAGNLRDDFRKVSGNLPALTHSRSATGKRAIIVGTLGHSPYIDALAGSGKLDGDGLRGKNEKYLMTTIGHPLPGIDEALVIAGSDRRGTIYGIYELSEQIGVSPWYDWADVPVEPRRDLSLARGTYTAGEPAVKYRGIFLNDEAPCLTGWVKHTYGTDYGDHRFYARVFELILRLRGNYMWPAMWSWSFYADDPENSRTAREMGIIMGTSHHEPMARNHQEWARRRKEYGEWNYRTNQAVIDRFFREGIERAAGTEDLITIGMRGDGDAPMGGEEGRDHEYQAQYGENIRLMERIFRNQRQIIEEVTGQAPERRPQVWAIYKEVQKYYDMGLRPPKDVIMLVCDDNWGNARRLPDAKEREHPGGWGMYYHVDYVGAPRNTKWLNVTPIQNLWEQMRLTYDYGVDKLWILNVGDLKPMEYPITLFLDMAWNPGAFTAANLLDHTRRFCAQQLGEGQADEAARILNLYGKYAGRVTPEMLDARTYNLETGEWRQVTDQLIRLEAEALRQYITIGSAYRDTYRQLILFPVQALANLYEMYYAQAMNHHLYQVGDPAANDWADRTRAAFRRDSLLCDAYNNVMAGGKWKNMMIQKHIGYTNWNDDFPANKLPEVFRIETSPEAARAPDGHYVFDARQGVVSIEAEHYYTRTEAADGARWTVIPYMGRTLSGLALMPYTQPVDGASLAYRMTLPATTDSVTVHVVVKSTLAFQRTGHRYTLGFEGGEPTTIHFNADLNEEPRNIYSTFYPTVARRVVAKRASFALPPAAADGTRTLVIRPLDPGIVFQKIVVDCGGYKESYLFMDESPYRKARRGTDD